MSEKVEKEVLHIDIHLNCQGGSNSVIFNLAQQEKKAKGLSHKTGEIRKTFNLPESETVIQGQYLINELMA